MLKRTLFPWLFFCLFAVVRLEAANVSVLVIETGLPREGSANAYSVTWENGIMDTLFDAGHIVSNAPIMRLVTRAKDGFPDEAERDWKEAQQSGMGYFLIAVVNYPQPYNVSLRLFNTSSPEMLHEVKYVYRTPRSDKEEYENIKRAIGEIAARLR